MSHVTPRRTYYMVFLALMVLTAVTTGVAFLDLGPLNIFVALAIAFVKATMVVLIFMHVRETSNLTKLYVVAGVFWLGILFVLTLNDYWTRGWMFPVNPW